MATAFRPITDSMVVLETDTSLEITADPVQRPTATAMTDPTLQMPAGKMMGPQLLTTI